MRQTADEKIEALKQKMNTSNIIKDDVFNTSVYSQKQTPHKTSYAPMAKSNFSFKESVRIDDLRNKIERELAQSVTLESEKKELELLLQDQIEVQGKLKTEYAKHFENVRNQMENVSQKAEGLEKSVQERNGKLLKKVEENEAMESDIADLTEDNKLIESELKRLGEKTTAKLREMQQKMQTALNDFETLKQKNEQELEKLRSDDEKARRSAPEGHSPSCRERSA